MFGNIVFGTDVFQTEMGWWNTATGKTPSMFFGPRHYYQ